MRRLNDTAVEVQEKTKPTGTGSQPAIQESDGRPAVFKQFAWNKSNTIYISFAPNRRTSTIVRMDNLTYKNKTTGCVFI
jgi:hypothetical protein